MPEDMADDSRQTVKSFLIIYQVCFNTVFLNIDPSSFSSCTKVYTIESCSFTEISLQINPFLSAVQANLYLKNFDLFEK